MGKKEEDLKRHCSRRRLGEGRRGYKQHDLLKERWRWTKNISGKGASVPKLRRDEHQGEKGGGQKYQGTNWSAVVRIHVESRKFCMGSERGIKDQIFSIICGKKNETKDY